MSKKPTVTIERVFKAPLEKVWNMWTTREGLEKWWSPEGMTSLVRQLDLRVGGSFEIVMTAVRKDVIDHVNASGVGESNVMKGRYAQLVTHQRLAYTNFVDFIPGVKPYEATTVVEFSPLPGGTRLVVINEAMHDDQWTKLATMGWESQLNKLTAALA
jgi:uncharacterized protein YndB with AHSA1/START domain